MYHVTWFIHETWLGPCWCNIEWHSCGFYHSLAWQLQYIMVNAMLQEHLALAKVSPMKSHILLGTQKGHIGWHPLCWSILLCSCWQVRSFQCYHNFRRTRSEYMLQLVSAGSQWPLIEHWPDLGPFGLDPALSHKWPDKQPQYGPLSSYSCLSRMGDGVFMAKLQKPLFS